MPREQIAHTLEVMGRALARPYPSVERMRKALDASAAVTPQDPETVRTEVDAGGVRAVWFSVPGSSSNKAMLYFHGGGYIVGSIKTHAGVACRLARAAGVRVLLPEYRLAPEHPHPAQVEDATRVYDWLLEQGIEPGNVAVGGDSAGGGLALALLVTTRNAGRALPCCCVLLSPWVDLGCGAASLDTNAADDPWLSKAWCERAATHLLGDLDRHTPLASPLFADLRGLPPLLVHAGGSEILLDDSRRLDEAAREAGVDVTIRVWSDMPHAFHLFAPALDEAGEALVSAGRYIARRMSSV